MGRVALRLFPFCVIYVWTKQNPKEILAEFCTANTFFGYQNGIAILRIDITAISDQTNHKKFFESVAKQHFQKISWFGFERKAL
jgi:hypothetical protein